MHINTYTDIYMYIHAHLNIHIHTSIHINMCTLLLYTDHENNHTDGRKFTREMELVRLLSDAVHKIAKKIGLLFGLD